MTLWLATAWLATANVASPAPPPDPAHVMDLPPELHARLQARVAGRGLADRQRLQRVVDFIFDSDGIALTYDDTETRTVEEVYRTGKANCLSFTMLFLAMSRDVGFEAKAQEVGQVLSWHTDADTFYTSGHVNAGVRVGSARWTADLDRSAAYSPHGPSAIDDQRLLAHYYNNRGVELMAAKQYAAAGAHMREALALAPDLADARNSLGVLALRQGDPAGALAQFHAALEAERSNAGALSNLVAFYQQRGDAANEARYLKRLRRAQSRDPFRQYLMASEAERAGRYDEAVRHYRRAIRLYDGAHQFHFGLARTYFLMNETPLAQRELARALELGKGDEAVERRYAAKLASVRQWMRGATGHQDPPEREMR